MTSGKSRLDLMLVRMGLFDTREKAQRAVMAGMVRVDGHPASKPGQSVGPDQDFSLTGKEKYVGRGGLKLERALEAFEVRPEGRVCADIGASTGGFTDCLLQHGATMVFALDVGHGQLDWKLRQDPRVVVREGINARYITAKDFDPIPTLVSADVSFISLTLIFPPIFELLPADGDMIVLIKPQSELSKAEVGKGGIVREEALREKAIEKIRSFIESTGHRWLGVVPSPITGRDGNVEFLAHVRP